MAFYVYDIDEENNAEAIDRPTPEIYFSAFIL